MAGCIGIQTQPTCCEIPCVDCPCPDGTQVQMQTTWGNLRCDCAMLNDSFVLTRTAAFTPIGNGNTCLDYSCDSGCSPGGKKCLFELANQTGLLPSCGDEYEYSMRCAIYRSLDKKHTVVSVAVVINVNPQASYGCIVLDGPCSDVDVDVPLRSCNNTGSACIQPTSVRITVI